MKIVIGRDDEEQGGILCRSPIGGRVLYTSNFARASDEVMAISIARFPPKWFYGDSFPALRPPPLESLLAWDEYAAFYHDRVLSRLDPVDVARDLNRGSILLCWCPKGANCHRVLVREWFNAVGIKCKEL